jgi:hypothetical protein
MEKQKAKEDLIALAILYAAHFFPVVNDDYSATRAMKRHTTNHTKIKVSAYFKIIS